MKYEEEIIAAFRYVWENQPEVFENSGAIAGLAELQEGLSLPNQSDKQIVAFLDKWCEDYKEVTDAVSEAFSRKIKLENNAPKQDSQDSNSLANLNPTITSVLRERQPKTGEGNSQ